MYILILYAKLIIKKLIFLLLNNTYIYIFVLFKMDRIKTKQKCNPNTKKVRWSEQTNKYIYFERSEEEKKFLEYIREQHIETRDLVCRKFGESVKDSGCGSSLDIFLKKISKLDYPDINLVILFLDGQKHKLDQETINNYPFIEHLLDKNIITRD